MSSKALLSIEMKRTFRIFSKIHHQRAGVSLLAMDGTFCITSIVLGVVFKLYKTVAVNRHYVMTAAKDTKKGKNVKGDGELHEKVKEKKNVTRVDRETVKCR